MIDFITAFSAFPPGITASSRSTSLSSSSPLFFFLIFPWFPKGFSGGRPNQASPTGLAWLRSCAFDLRKRRSRSGGSDLLHFWLFYLCFLSLANGHWAKFPATLDRDDLAGIVSVIVWPATWWSKQTIEGGQVTGAEPAMPEPWMSTRLQEQILARRWNQLSRSNGLDNYQN